MNREFLRQQGLNDEQIEAVMSEYGKSVNAIKEKADKVESLEAQINDHKQQLSDRDKQLEELKKIDAEGLQAKIKELQQENEAAKSEYESKLKDTQLTSALKLALAGKVHDADLVANLIDKETIELGEDGSITKGLDEQIKTLQESKSFLFVEKQEEKPPAFRGFTPPEGKPSDKNPTNNVGESFAKIANERVNGTVVENNPWG